VVTTCGRSAGYKIGKRDGDHNVRGFGLPAGLQEGDSSRGERARSGRGRQAEMKAAAAIRGRAAAAFTRREAEE
jgi:hypothetical protein